MHAHLTGWQKAQLLLYVLCIGCALLLIALSLNGRTVWTAASRGSTAWIRDAAGWDWVAGGAGIMAVITLSAGLFTSHRWLMIACTATASTVLAWATYVAWRYSQDIALGLVNREGFTVRTPEQIGVAMQVAAIASTFGLVLLAFNIRSAIRRA